VKLLGATLLAAVALLVAELAAGGLHHGGQHVADPCRPRPALQGSGLDASAQRLTLRGLDFVACRTGKSREQLVLDLGAAGVNALQRANRLGSRLPGPLGALLKRLGVGS
jgi:hypothetical protein